MSYDDNYRAVMGERLRAFRLSRHLTTYKVAKDSGLQIGQINAIEDGTKNYTIDAFIKYVRGCGLYLFFGEKSTGAQLDEDDMMRSLRKNDPKL